MDETNKFPPSKRKSVLLTYTIVFPYKENGYNPSPWERKRKFKSIQSAEQALQALQNSWIIQHGGEIKDVTLVDNSNK